MCERVAGGHPTTGSGRTQQALTLSDRYKCLVFKGKRIAFLSSAAVNPEKSSCISEGLWVFIFGAVGIKPHKNRDKPWISAEPVERYQVEKRVIEEVL
jgi:hypothetical protein